MPELQITVLDITMVGVYIVAIVGIGLYFSQHQESTADYFLAGRSLTWATIGFSLFASNMSTSSLVGMAGDAYAYGIAVYNYEWMAVLVLILFGLFFLPVYLRLGVFTMPEFLERRFDIRSRYYLSAVTVVGNVMIDMAGALYAGGLVVQIIFPEVPMWQSVVILALLSGLYTITGGLKAVVYTDVIQAVLLITASCVVSVIAFNEVGSWTAVTEATPPEMLRLIQPVDDPILPWPGLVTGVFLLGFYYWGTNQFMVQRTLGAKNLDQARWGTLFTALLKIPVLFVMVLPGTFARVLYGPEALTQADIVFPTLLFDLLPVGIRGIVLAALVAAIMSSVDSTLNSASTLITMDFVKSWKPNISNKALVIIGRLVTGLFMLFAAVWAPFIVDFPSLWQYLQTVLAYLSPPVVACFFVGIFWPRANRHSAIAALSVGHLAAVVLAVAEWQLPSFSIQFLYLPPILLTISVATMIVVSKTGKKPDPSVVNNFTWTFTDIEEELAYQARFPWYKNFFVQASFLLVMTTAVVWLFW